MRLSAQITGLCGQLEKCSFQTWLTEMGQTRGNEGPVGHATQRTLRVRPPWEGPCHEADSACVCWAQMA